VWDCRRGGFSRGTVAELEVRFGDELLNYWWGALLNLAVFFWRAMVTLSEFLWPLFLAEYGRNGPKEAPFSVWRLEWISLQCSCFFFPPL
jgi:hypothetical protein